MRNNAALRLINFQIKACSTRMSSATRAIFCILIFNFSLSSQLLHGQDKGWTFYDTLNRSLPSNFITKIVEAADGTMWVAQGSNHISAYTPSGWKTFYCPNNVPWGHEYTNIRDIAFTSDHKLVLAGTVGWLMFFDPKKREWDWKASPHGVQFLKIQCDSNDICLLGSMRGLYQYHNGTFTQLESDSTDVMGITLKGKDAWVGFRGGFYRYHLNNKMKYVQRQRVSEWAIYESAVLDKNDLWATSYSTLYLHHFNDTGQAQFDSLPQSIYYDYNGQWRYVAHNIILDTLHNPIVSTQFGAHVAWLQDGQWKPYTVPIWMRDNVSFDGVASLAMRSDGSLWIGTWHHGIVVLSDVKSKYPKIKVTPKPAIQQQNQQQPIPKKSPIVIPETWDAE